MNLHVGSGSVRIKGFVNVDIRKEPEVDIVGHVGDLPTIGDGTVETLFGNAVFEHIFIGHQLATLREWKRLIGSSGRIIMLALPDFRTIAELYLRREPGIFGDRFDLHNVYRYTHGEPEHSAPPIWQIWQPSPRSQAPPGYIPQLHKGLFDAGYLRGIVEEAGLSPLVFNYAFPGEKPLVNLGFIATAKALTGDPEKSIRGNLACVPGVERFVDLQTITPSDERGQESLVSYAKDLSSRRPEAFKSKVARRLSRMLCRK